MSLSNTVLHYHHITPKHMEGSDDPSNLIELTIDEHAIWHYELWVYYGKQEDYIAWKAISKQINSIQIQNEINKLLSQKMKGVKKPETFRISLLGKPSNSSGKKWTTEQKQKLSKQRKGVKRSQTWINSFNNNQKKLYEIIAPDGSINTYRGLQDFYQNYGLIRSQVYACANGKRPDVNGYKINVIQDAITKRKRIKNVSI